MYGTLPLLVPSHKTASLSGQNMVTFNSRILRLFFAFIFYIYTSPLLLNAQPIKQVRGVIHLDSTISGGEMAPEELVRLLKENGMHAAFFSDQITTRVHYGIFPVLALTEWLSASMAASKFGREGSVTTTGAYNYLSLLNDLNRKYEDMTVVPGVEVYPFYYWRKNLLRGEITMVNGHKHFLAIGLEKASDYENMPTVSEGFYKGYNLQTLLSLWPLALLLLAFKCYRQSRYSLRSGLFKASAQIFFVVGILFLVNNYPYKFGRYNVYQGDQGQRPYQDFIDYVIGRGGLVFFAHPEASQKQTHSMGPLTINLQTEAPYKDLLHLRNYTGFAAFYEGMKYIIPPGGIWDQVLTEYCFAQRKQPIWAIGEGDVEGDSFDPGLSQTVFLVKENTRPALIQALRTGQIYAIAGPYADELSLDLFTLSDETGKQASMGQTLKTKTVHLMAQISLKGNEKRNALSADLIKNGILIDTFKGDGQITIDLQDTLDTTMLRHHYYRIDVRAPNQTRLLTNPIFASPPKDS
jgi:hypothetical protein